MILHLLIKAMESPFLFIVILCSSCAAIALLIIWTVYLTSEQNKLWKQCAIIASLILFLILVIDKLTDILVSV